MDLEREIHRILPTKQSVAEKMAALLDCFEANYPDEPWESFRNFDYDAESKSLSESWMTNVCEASPPRDVTVAGIHFGLYRPMRRLGAKMYAVADFYICGSKRFELDAVPGDFVCGPEYFPDSRYANSNVLARIYLHAQRLENGSCDAEQYLCHGYVTFLLCELFRDVDLKLLVSKDKPVGVTTGWDSGDLLFAGTLTSAGFRPRPAREATSALTKRRKAYQEYIASLNQSDEGN